MARDIAITIGVADSIPRRYLSGAINGAQAFHDWAQKLGYESTLLTDEDENNPVTMERLRSAILAAVAGDHEIHRLVLYFAGHGLIREAEEGLWLLSDWRKELQAVAIEVLKRRLSMYYNIAQLAIFADCCRSLPQDIGAADLTPHGVIGLGRFPPREPLPRVDKFIATQDGKETFAIPGESPKEDRCIFSGVLLEGLWGTQPGAFSSLMKDAITSQSLGEYLESEVPKLALRYGRKLVPSVYPAFRVGDDVYFRTSFSASPPKFPHWPPPTGRLVTGQGLEGTFSTKGLAAGSEESDELALPIEAENPGRVLLDQLRREPQPEGILCGFAVNGSRVRQFWIPSDVKAQKTGSDNWWSVRLRAQTYVDRPLPVLIEFDDGMFAATTALPSFVASILRDERGIPALVYRPPYGQKDTIASVEMALASMEDGNLKANALSDLAVGLRQEKHYDPVLGVISAYLYDSIGDIANIRRMAYYYTLHRQPIPYDIALLAQLQGDWQDDRLWVEVPEVSEQKPESAKEPSWTHERTPAARGEVGGLWPWMRQGWTFLDDPVDLGSTLVRPGLLPLMRHMARGRFAMLDAEGGRGLAEIFKLSP
jgi:hypothetical protein